MRILSLFALAAVSVTAYAAAPFFQSFHNVPYKTLRNNFNYYPSQGYGARTLSVYRTGFLKPILAAGAFDKGVSASIQVTFSERSSTFGDSFKTKDGSGFRPREISVYIGDKNVDGAPGDANFTTLWEKKDGRPSAAYVGLSEQGFEEQYQHYVVRNGYRPLDHVSYYEYGQIRHAVIFIKDGAGFYFYRGMTADQFNARSREMSQRGFVPANLNVLEVPGAFYYSCIWKPATTANVMYFGLSGEGYQQKWEELNRQGYRLVKIQGYNKGTNFAAIWEK